MTDMSPFGGLLVPLPFKIRSFQQSSANDVCINPWYTSNNDHPEAVMVIGLPDEGVFDYVDYFLKQNPHKYVELSERTMFDWLRKSGLKTLKKSGSASNDRPGHQYGVKPLDVHTGMLKQLRRFLENAHHQRSVVHVEVEKGLSEVERKKLMSDYTMKRRVAVVCVGHPDKGYLEYVQGLVGADLERKKTGKARSEWKKKMGEYTKRKEEREAQKRRESLMEAAAKARKDAAEEARQKRQEAAARAAAAKKAAEARTSGGASDAQGPVAGGQSPIGMDNGTPGAVEEEGEKEEEETEPQMPEIEVTSEEIMAKMAGGGRFRKLPLPDLTKDAVTSAFLRFSLPSADEELRPGVPVFNGIRFVWDGEEEARTYLTTWIKNHKILERVSSIKGPSEWFTKQLESWTQTKVEWRKLDRMYRDKKTAAIKEGTEGQKEGEEEDVWAAEDIDNVDGEQTPLYGQFEAVDWNLLSLRFELHLLCHSFKKDVSDADVVGIHRSLLGYYYLLYFKKNLTPGICGAKSIDDLLDRLVTDTIMVDDRGVLMAVHEVDTPFSTFVRLTEAARRERQKLIAAGDNSAELVVKNAAESERSEAKSTSVLIRVPLLLLRLVLTNSSSSSTIFLMTALISVTEAMVKGEPIGNVWFVCPLVSLIMEGAKEPSKETVDLPSPPASESAPPQQAEVLQSSSSLLVDPRFLQTIGAKDVEMVDAGAPSVAGGASTGQPEEPVGPGAGVGGGDGRAWGRCSARRWIVRRTTERR
ncbi:hypothetical protein FOZ61_000163 [Perkinsus olseni]|uniref:Uncharacterized protein n=1 Tax=Perkinsus olseni TaxID=32597 RepID=A0A7J6M0Q4_PEROL|nr:hypothetical protein FOZ61_000163 [Perkinsus olseni]